MRREYEFGVGTIQGVAHTFEVHRRLVREALRSAVLGERPAWSEGSRTRIVTVARPTQPGKDS